MIHYPDVYQQQRINFWWRKSERQPGTIGKNYLYLHVFLSHKKAHSGGAETARSEREESILQYTDQ
jgi:hypothetical protein